MSIGSLVGKEMFRKSQNIFKNIEDVVLAVGFGKSTAKPF
jgi:hypothetical protein